MKKNIFMLLVMAFISKQSLADSTSVPVIPPALKPLVCYPGKYIVGIQANFSLQGRTAVYLSDTLNSAPNPPEPIPFAEPDSSPTGRILYSMSQSAVNLHQKPRAILCNERGQILSFAVIPGQD
ncbi:hypothetical protein ABKV83_22940 (plasmid) [Enterobacter asburiae]|uniref:hypothetical protein n=1 Tax=Enterobacter asburiae TaxID=61645 RepID=UPI0032B00313|nr:hypothetical protein [Enterobacter asburiae]